MLRPWVSTWGFLLLTDSKTTIISTMSDEILICSCSSMEHQLIFSTDENYPIVYVRVHLCKKSFWKRLIHAIRYVFGYTSKFGDWEEVVLDYSHVDKLKHLINHLEDENINTISYH